jgi:hypothetical protein
LVDCAPSSNLWEPTKFHPSHVLGVNWIALQEALFNKAFDDP